MTVLHYFAGANTAQGFYSHYDYLAQDNYRRVFILKGGPGTGKSTVLKRIVSQFQPHQDVDLFHCSADVDSLDGIYLPKQDVSALDGTAPHTIDPHLPGVVQEIIDMGSCWDGAGLRRSKKEIQELKREISNQYKSAYTWLAIAAHLVELDQHTPTPSLKKQAKTDAGQIIKLLPDTGRGHSRKAFASAITERGLVNYLPSLQKHSACSISLTGRNRIYNATVLNLIQETLVERRVPATYLYCGLQPQYLEHIFIPGVFALFSSHWPHQISGSDYQFGPLPPAQTELTEQQSWAMNEGVKELAQARSLHLDMEKLYIPHVNYHKVNLRQKEIIAAIKAEKTR